MLKMTSWEKRIPILTLLGGVVAFMATIPYDSARTSIASYFKAVGLNTLAAALVAVALFAAFAFLYTRRRTVDLSKLLVGKEWMFFFNPVLGRSKRLSFNTDGTIGEGRNSNEFRWTASNGRLSLVRENGDLQNQFAFNDSAKRFVAVDNQTAKGLKGQYIQML